MNQNRRTLAEFPRTTEIYGFPVCAGRPQNNGGPIVFFGPIEPLGLVKPLACAGSLGQDMTGQDTRQDLGSAGLSAAIITTH